MDKRSTVLFSIPGAQADGLQRSFWPLCQAAPATRSQQGKCYPTTAPVTHNQENKKVLGSPLGPNLRQEIHLNVPNSPDEHSDLRQQIWSLFIFVKCCYCAHKKEFYSWWEIIHSSICLSCSLIILLYFATFLVSFIIQVLYILIYQFMFTFAFFIISKPTFGIWIWQIIHTVKCFKTLNVSSLWATNYTVATFQLKGP